MLSNVQIVPPLFKVKKCNWLRHLGTKKHRDGIEHGGSGGDMGEEGEGTGGRSGTAPLCWILTLLYIYI